MEAQRNFDHMAHSLTESSDKVGPMVSNQVQIAEFHEVAPPGAEVTSTWSSPYASQRFAEAAAEIKNCDVIVMLCMGYDDAHRAVVREVTGKPVLLEQQMLAAAWRN